MGIRHVSEPVGAGLSSGGTERGGGSMKVGRRFATLLAVVLAAALTLVGGRAAPSAQASTKASKVVIWTDSYRKAVAPDNAPDVIVGAHDWTGQLAADGSVVALFPTKAIKKGFPGYALKAMAYNGKQYGIPTQLENIGLIVNTALAKVPTTWAQLESRALAFKKKGSGRIAIAVPQGSGGDAYHMYPFFSGLGGYVFGARKNGALNPQNLCVANKTFLNKASMIDKLNREGLIDSKIDYGQAKNAFLDKKAAFWITGPWETEALQKSGIKFRIVQVPKIKFRAVPFLGVQGFFVTKFAAGHGTASAAKDLVSNYMGKAGAQFDLATANSRYPANVAAGKRVHDPILSAFGKAIAVFSGPVGLAVKIALLAVMNGIAVWAATILAGDHNWIAVAVLAAATLAIDAIYLSGRAVPAKFLIPGTIFLLAFQLIPILYTINVAFDKYSTGHVSSRSDAIQAIKQNSLSETASGTAYSMAPARDASGKIVLVLVDQDTNKPYVGDTKGLKPLPSGSVVLNSDGAITSATGYTLVKGSELFSLDRTLSTYTVPVGSAGAIRPQGLDTAVVLQQTLRYDPKAETFTRIKDGVVFRDDGKGSFKAAGGEELEPGWRARIGFANFDRLIHDPLVRKPFVRVFIWTFFFALSTVLLSFALGLFLAIALDKKGMRLQRFYRSVLVIPYAIPGLLSILVWSGLLNDRFGVVNHAFHLDVPWLFDANWAKVSVILVSLWLTFPYFFLVSMGALQSVPSELYEAARVDGGGAWQVFRKVTLPLLLIAVAPLMIASFAFNFNNFNNIYLLTAGGPAMGESTVAGSTDILISYTYKLAIATGKGQDYGLASAITIIIFLIVATISAISFSRTKALENLA